MCEIPKKMIPKNKTIVINAFDSKLVVEFFKKNKTKIVNLINGLLK